jgi:hypothetical protein
MEVNDAWRLSAFGNLPLVQHRLDQGKSPKLPKTDAMETNLI